MLKCESGVYAIVNTLNGKRYIGSSVHMRKRWNIHKHYLNAGKIMNRHLSAAWKKYGAEVFEFVPLEYVQDVTKLHIREQWHLERYLPNVYNLTGIIASPALGRKHSEEARAKMKAKRAMQVFSVETRQKMRDAWKVREITPALRAILRANSEKTQDFLRAQTHCRNGHSYADAYSQKGSRRCRTCQQLAAARYLKRKRQAVA